MSSKLSRVDEYFGASEWINGHPVFADRDDDDVARDMRDYRALGFVALGLSAVILLMVAYLIADALARVV